MKVLLVSTSPRIKGNTYTALSEAAKILYEEGIEAEIIEIGTKPIRGCIACQWCKNHPAEKRCVFDDDITNSISAKAGGGGRLYFRHPGLLRAAQWLRLMPDPTHALQQRAGFYV